MKRSALALALGWALSGCTHGPQIRPEALRSALNLGWVAPTPFRPLDLNGRVVLVEFFATWCFPCIADMPNLDALQKRYHAQGLQVVAVGVDLEGVLVLEPFANQYQFSFPVLVASTAIREGTSPFGKIAALPTTVLLDREGGVVAAYEGVLDLKHLEQLVEGALRR